ncbi:hypothetical protein [uncultured Gammaproteobacteria bacterium]|nr:hypothetical protein [uncultured Gammaproteobacteria bacterium]CAC9952824.1 hypothetical protein [uncultured Gammaproteobacteria bacterium]CAC9970990.1 hypothetical protein [uncultured Gammaproteobacteria bacterium]CAC9985549.1 hypothetical protein [uncultured Gammaproteobacteria bacterium]
MEIIFQRVLIYLKKSKKYLFYSVMDNESICQIRNKKNAYQTDKHRPSAFKFAWGGC